MRLYSNRKDFLMTATGLLHELAGQGIRLMAHGEQIAADAPRGALTDALRHSITEQKAELLVLLAQEPMVPEGDVLATNPTTGQRFITHLYRCPACGGTRWGPRADRCWHCLACAAVARVVEESNG
jgi:hypothetical protein